MSTDMSHTTINNQLARVVWQHYFVDGRIEQLCYCCNEQRINVWSYQCGHVIAAAKNGPTTVDNLRPICSACNQGMGTQDMREFSKVNGFQGLLSAERGLSAPYPPTQVASNQAPNQASNRQRYDSVVVHMGAERPHNPLYTSTNDQDHMEADDQDHVGVDDQDNKKHKLRDRCVIS